MMIVYVLELSEERVCEFESAIAPLLRYLVYWVELSSVPKYSTPLLRLSPYILLHDKRGSRHR